MLNKQFYVLSIGVHFDIYFDDVLGFAIRLGPIIVLLLPSLFLLFLFVFFVLFLIIFLLDDDDSRFLHLNYGIIVSKLTLGHHLAIKTEKRQNRAKVLVYS